ncbi:MAG TPA: hypothetical protein VGY53_06575 [Isosphaeraceae bacterium]|nr:hypothetical protein [Isosphaeraceae bacterium]
MPPERTIGATLRSKVVGEARLDAAAYYREFRAAAGPEGTGWVEEAWADLRRFLKLDADVADRLWPVYWKAFREETVKLAASRTDAR